MNIKKSNKISNQITLNISEETTTEKKIANHFNDFFTSITRKLFEKIQTPKSIFHLYLTKTTQNSFFTTSEEIEDIISCIQRNKATGPSSIPIKILKDLKKTISKPLVDLINSSFNSGKFRNCIKTATVIQIFIKGDQQNIDLLVFI